MRTSARRRENPVRGPVARQLLGHPGPPIGASRYSAIRKAMGLTGRYVFVSDIQEWLERNPGFSETQIYPRRGRARKAVGL